MNRTSTAKEALIAEALGDLAHLLDRLETVGPQVDAARAALLESSTAIAREIAAFEPDMHRFTQFAKVQTEKYVAQQLAQATIKAREEQVRLMEAAAREMFRTNVEPLSRQLIAQLQQLALLARQRNDLWTTWLGPITNFALGASMTWLLLTVWRL